MIKLEQNYRSTPQVLALANRLVPKLGGSAKTLRATLSDGPEPDVGPELDVVARIQELVRAGVPLEEQAVLVRTNARTTEFEEAFHEAGIPFQGASLLARDAARQLLKALRGAGGSAAEAVRRVATAQGCSRICRRSSASASRRGRPTSRGSSGSRSSSTATWRRSSTRCTSASARPPAEASTS